jgi:ankyrin repeat protein
MQTIVDIANPHVPNTATVQDYYSMTSLHLAVLHGQQEVVKYLLDYRVVAV